MKMFYISGNNIMNTKKLLKKTLNLTLASIFSFSILGTSISANACSTVFLNQFDSVKVVGRNMDFMYPCDPVLMISPRGIHRIGSSNKDALSWTSKYGSVITVVHDIFTSEGINEKGLSAHAQAFTNKEQTINNIKGPVLDSNYWINYILDTHETVQQVIDDLSKIKMRAVFFPVTYPTDSKHIAIEDKTGDSAVIEIYHGRLNIYHGKDFNVMTNYPTLDQHIKAFKVSSKNNLPLDSGAVSRFIRLKNNLNAVPKPRSSQEALGYINSIINSAAFVIGQPIPDEDQLFVEKYSQYASKKEELRGAATYWQTLSDLNNPAYYFKSISAENYLKIDLKKIDFEKLHNVKRLDNIMNIDSNNHINAIFTIQEGDIYSHYKK
ncbi:linear amide C-N hydrolase [Photobacterium kishitanii]|nr:linear amide C-N hydrolase [Photobacterium kishitanii]PSV74185.1 linear amide C-N hydrolase [Photobacterium kishitanii]